MYYLSYVTAHLKIDLVAWLLVAVCSQRRWIGASLEKRTMVKAAVENMQLLSHVTSGVELSLSRALLVYMV